MIKYNYTSQMSKHPVALRAASSCDCIWKAILGAGATPKIRNTDSNRFSLGHHVACVLLFFRITHCVVVMNDLSYMCVLIAADKTWKMRSRGDHALRSSDVLPFWPACKLTNRRAGGIPLVPASPCWWQAQEKGPNHLPRDLLRLRARLRAPDLFEL